MSGGLYLISDERHDLGSMGEGVHMSPHGTRKRLHHLEVGGRDRGRRHNDGQGGVPRRSATPLKRG